MLSFPLPHPKFPCGSEAVQVLWIRDHRRGTLPVRACTATLFQMDKTARGFIKDQEEPVDEPFPGDLGRQAQGRN